MSYIELSPGASGTQYTSPGNGWMYAYGKASAINQYLVLSKVSSSGHHISIITTSPTASGVIRTYIPVLKNQVIQITYTTTGTFGVDFIYAEGS